MLRKPRRSTAVEERIPFSQDELQVFPPLFLKQFGKFLASASEQASRDSPHCETIEKSNKQSPGKQSLNPVCTVNGHYHNNLIDETDYSVSKNNISSIFVRQYIMY